MGEGVGELTAKAPCHKGQCCVGSEGSGSDPKLNPALAFALQPAWASYLPLCCECSFHMCSSDTAFIINTLPGQQLFGSKCILANKHWGNICLL